MFRDRHDAGRRLAQNLERYAEKDAVVLALPRGGVVLGREVADALKLPLDIVVARKIGHPNNPEYAIAAVDEKGMLLCDEAERRTIDPQWLEGERERQRQEAHRRVVRYRGEKQPPQVKGKIAIIVDDGIATGLTMRLAIKAIRAHMPAKIVVAVPVAPSDSIARIRREADELVVLEPPEEFLGAVGAHYEEFDQVADEEVVRLLG